ncbi:MAG: 30S ribosomal protein S9 [Alphaproteobacteria bacterium]|nr:MAG: 30S ribosomal protein S9 [Alphaproteobacteria bacterium]
MSLSDNQEIAAPKLDKLGRSYATGKRKSSIARVWIKKGTGKMSVNGQEAHKYFVRPTLQMMVHQPFERVNQEFDVFATIEGGGLSGQAGALRHGISKAISLFNPELRPTLKQAGFLTRDAREVERKKPGRPKARKKFQFSKR